MKTRQQASLRRKLFLAIFVPSLIVSLVLGGLGLWVDLEAMKDALKREASILADLLARAVSGPMTINDEQTLNSTLEAAGAQGNVISATATSADGTLVASYTRPNLDHFDHTRTFRVTREIGMGMEIIGELSVRVSLEPYYSRRAWYVVGAIGSLVVLTGVAGAVAVLLQRRLLTPLDTLTTTARAISAGRNYSVRAQQFQDAEFQPLTSAFNQMLEEIQKQTEALNSANAGLRRANAELEAFTYSVSHDLRTPLRAISSFAQILNSSEEPLSDEGRQALQTIQRNAARMAQLIDDLLAFSRIDAHPLETKPVDLTRIARDAWNEVEGLTQGRAIECHIEHLGVEVVDPGLFHQVYLNLLSNAVKYSRTRDKAVIVVGKREQDGEDQFFVQDNGVGFDMKYASKLFRVFERLHAEHEFEGTGVGLALVQRIIARHGGRIWAHAEVDKGATFYFTIGTS